MARITKTHSCYKQDLKDLGIKVKPLENYEGSIVKIKHRCTCGATWLVQPTCVLKGYKCKACASNSMRRTHVDYIQSISGALKERRISVVGKYVHSRQPMTFKCLVCKNVWDTRPERVRVCGCPSCKVRKRTSAFFSTNKTIKVGRRTVSVQGYEPYAISLLLQVLKPSKLKFGVDVPIVKLVSGKNHYPDIWIPEFNLLVEVKSTYTFGLNNKVRYKSVIEKAVASITAGYNYFIMVMSDKGELVALYTKFNLLYSKAMKTLREGKNKNIGAVQIAKHLKLI